MSTAATEAGLAFRAAVHRAHGASPAESDELLAYTRVELRPPPEPPSFPLDDEPFAAAWAAYADEAAAAGDGGAWECLRTRLPQLRFPIREGISGTELYRAATRRGEPPPSGDGVVLARPEALRIVLHPTPAGRLPVLVAGCREDFVSLVRALARQNEPTPIPASMGALMVAGFNNWDRVAALRAAFHAAHPAADGDAWRDRWRALIPRKELYQDRFVILSPGPYSGVAADEVGMEPGLWERTSLAIRLEHEAAHYFSRRVFGAMRTHAWDELVADFAGVAHAAGRYRGDWAARFLGVDGEEGFRPGGRLANYRGELSAGAFAALCSMAAAAVRALEAFDRGRPRPWSDVGVRAETLSALFALSVEELAAEDAGERLEAARGGPWPRA